MSRNDRVRCPKRTLPWASADETTHASARLAKGTFPGTFRSEASSGSERHRVGPSPTHVSELTGLGWGYGGEGRRKRHDRKGRGAAWESALLEAAYVAGVSRPLFLEVPRRVRKKKTAEDAEGAERS